jgi:para-aminobenzoate synthetase / 4-amino-4-deoxychorismate lyase
MQYAEPGRPQPAWLSFADPDRIVTAATPAEVVPALRTIEQAVDAGASAAGWMAYEAATGLDPCLKTAAPADGPLLRFGLYRAPTILEAFPCSPGPCQIGAWRPSISREVYRAAIAAIQAHIARGETYQVNFTLRLRAGFEGDPAGWFQNLCAAQQPAYAAWIDDGEETVCSVSPELFFALDGDRIRCRPMKGTAPRGPTTAADRARAAHLRASPKNRAENLMIVDMMRNDLGRIAETGSVAVDDLFVVEHYPTVLQMTSTVSARTAAGFTDILRALFPSCSITGAPKVRTMEIIRDLEHAPRGLYTGAIGFLLPRHPLSGQARRTARFNVAIRTAHIRRGAGTAEYGTGGGIVWDSEAGQEYEECLTKARILQPRPEPFALLETMSWWPATGVFLLEAHLDRLADSAAYFGRPFDRARVRQAVCEAVPPGASGPRRLRLLLAADGAPTIEVAPLTRTRAPWRVALDDRPAVDREDPFLHHKTTRRTVYEQSLARHPWADDVILWNDRGELTESCLANLLVKLRGVWCTPPVDSGLLAGTLRGALLRRGRIREAPLTRADLQQAGDVLLINSVRGAIRIAGRPGTDR